MILVTLGYSFVEFLLNRDTATTLESRHLRYDIVTGLVNSQNLRDSFDAETVLRLREYYKQGAFYVKADTEVATEGES